MITVITGPPCTGKTTYLQQHAKPGDLVIDYDTLARALGSNSQHDHPDWIRDITAAAWSAAVDVAATRYPGRTVWIIDSRPTRHRQQAYQRAHARTVALNAAPAELHRRADNDRRGQRAHDEIDRWFAAADPQPKAGTRW